MENAKKILEDIIMNKFYSTISDWVDDNWSRPLGRHDDVIERYYRYALCDGEKDEFDNVCETLGEAYVYKRLRTMLKEIYEVMCI